MTEFSDMVLKAKVEKRDESIAVFDLGTVVERFRLWKKCFPDIQPFYAVKVYDDPVVVSLLAYLGAGFDCASQSELNHVLSVGVDPSNVIYANTIKFPSHITFAVNNHVTLMTFDNEDELIKVKRMAPEARLVLRIAPNQDGGTVQWQLRNKFGCSRQRASMLLQRACALDLKVIGVSFHVGSGCSDARTYTSNIKAAHSIFDEAGQLGLQLTLLDIGGGLYGNVGSEEKIRQMCGPIKETLAALFPASSGVQIISEPGRYFVESAMTLGACVVGKRVPDTGLVQKNTAPTQNIMDQQELGLGAQKLGRDNMQKVDFEYYISESMYGCLSLHLYSNGHDYDPLPLNKYPMEPCMHASRLYGPTCDAMDVVQEYCQLPELEEGDWLAFRDVGAYTVTCAGTFNGIPKCQVCRVMNKNTWDNLFRKQRMN